jgi:hypothetical protein
MSTESINEASHARLTDLQIAEQMVEQAKADGSSWSPRRVDGRFCQDGFGNRS